MHKINKKNELLLFFFLSEQKRYVTITEIFFFFYPVAFSLWCRVLERARLEWHLPFFTRWKTWIFPFFFIFYIPVLYVLCITTKYGRTRASRRRQFCTVAPVRNIKVHVQTSVYHLRRGPPPWLILFFIYLRK